MGYGDPIGVPCVFAVSATHISPSRVKAQTNVVRKNGLWRTYSPRFRLFLQVVANILSLPERPRRWPNID